MADYQASAPGRDDKDYWKSQFADSFPTLDLPLNQHRGDVRTFNSQRYDHRIQADLLKQIRKSAAKQGCSLFQFTLIAFHAFLARLSGQADFCVGVPTAGQAAMDFQNLIGHCVNTVPIRNSVDFTESVQEYLQRSRSCLMNGLEHQRYTLGSLIRDLAPPRDPSRPPVFSVMINIDPEPDAANLGFTGLTVTMHVEPRTFENFEWFISGVLRQSGDLELQCQFNSTLFDRPSIAHYMECFQSFLLSMASEPLKRVGDLPLLSLRHREQLSVQWNATQRDFPNDSTLLIELQKQAERTPDRIAACFDRQSVSYSQLMLMTNQLAHHLKSQGVQPGERVGVCMPRSLEMLASTLAIWQVGACYVPLDPAYPHDRLRMMIQDSGLRNIIALTSLSSDLLSDSTQVIPLLEIRQHLSGLPTQPLDIKGSPNDTAYLIYTSGSTGKPKGVQVPHASVVNLLYAMLEQPGIDRDDRLLAITTLSFDISVLELFLPLLVGARVIIADQASVSDANRLKELIEQHDITFLQATPSTWRMLLAAGWDGKRPDGRLRVKALCGGEALPKDLANLLCERCAEVWNMYGPTETTVWSSAFKVTSAQSSIMIGKPIANTQFYVLDQFGQQVPIGAVGELYIGGAGVTKGYLNRPELTENRFVDNPFFNPFKEYANYRLYRTGDLVRYHHDGNLEYLQRNDNQVKLRGHRIELAEIEYRIMQLPQVAQAVAVVREDQANDLRLVAYYVQNDFGNRVVDNDRPRGTWADDSLTDEIRAALKETLPSYMIPQHFVRLHSLPLTANGKVDRKSLPAPQLQPKNSKSQIPQTSAERRLAGLWCKLLDLPEVSRDDNFFDQGGHSLLVMQAIAEIQQREGVRLSPQDFLVSCLQQIAMKLPQEEPAVGIVVADQSLGNISARER